MHKDIEQEYRDILSQEGRRVANRWLYAITRRAGRTGFGLADFYAMYADESSLPAHERRNSEMLAAFDPAGFMAHYPAPLPAYDTENECVKDFAALPAEWRAFVHYYLFVWTEEQKEDALLKELEAWPETGTNVLVLLR
jgi:hypothetical protein